MHRLESPLTLLIARVAPRPIVRVATPLAMATVVAAGVSLAATACRSAPTVDTPDAADAIVGDEIAGGEAPGGSTGAPPSLPAAVQLSGRLVMATAAEGENHNQVSALDLSDGTVTTLWRTGRGVNISDLTVSPDGRRLAYKAISLNEPPPESVVVHPLAADAEPLILAATDVDVARLDGIVWSPDSDAVIYGLQVGHVRTEADGVTPADAWELRVVDADDPWIEGGHATSDRLVWRAEGDDLGPVGLTVVGWDPAASRAAVIQTPAHGGPSTVVRVIDTSAGAEVSRVSTEVRAFDAIGSPDGRWVALPEAGESGSRVRALELATGRVVDIDQVASGAAPGAPVWSWDSRWLAWTEHLRASSQGVAPEVVIHAATVASEPGEADPVHLTHRIEGGSSLAVGFDPEGAYVIAAESAREAGDWVGLSVHPVPEGPAQPLPWPPLDSTWFASWVP